MKKLQPKEVVLGRYVVEAAMGAGAMGQVYRAEHTSLGRPVALKVLLNQDEPTLQARFMREAKVLAQIEHPNVVRVLDFGHLQDGSPCMVMEYLQGESFEQLLDKQPCLPWRLAVALVIQVLDGLGALHDVGVLHRDIKSSNLMCIVGEQLTVKLIDLGIAQGQAELGIKLTQTGTTVGSPAYMAPELLHGERATVASELYSVGMVLYELLCGSLPFGARSFADVMRRLSQPAPKPAEIELPEPLWAYLGQRLLAIDASLRPSNAHLVKAELERMLGVAAAPSVAPNSAAGAGGWVNPRAKRRSGAAQERSAPDEVGVSTMEELALRLSQSDTRVEPRATPTPPVVTPSVSRPRALLVASLPSTALSQAQEREWAQAQLEDVGRGFVFAGRYWVVVFAGTDDQRAMERCAGLTGALVARYGALARVEACVLEEGFSLSAAALSGLEPFPAQLEQLLARLQ